MSLNDEKALPEVLEGQKPDLVYDFLYHDARRVGSFLAQFDASGHLTGLKQTETAESSANVKFGATAGAGVLIAKGTANLEDQHITGEREALERSYDPLWTNALALLDFLTEKDLIGRNLETARIGQFVLASGTLSVTDLSLWKGLWSIPAVKGLIRSGIEENSANAINGQNRAERRAQGSNPAKKSKDKDNDEIEAAFAMVGMLPHTVQARLAEDSGSAVWCSLRDEGMVVSTTDMTLKHGIAIPGRWNILGVLDARPDYLEAAAQSFAQAPSAFGNMLSLILPAIRGLLGRPTNDYGVTPLMIFREITR